MKIEPKLIKFDEARSALAEVEVEHGIKYDPWQAKLICNAIIRCHNNPHNTRHLIAAPTGTGKTEIGIGCFHLFNKFLDVPHCAHAWLAERDILRNESQDRIEGGGLFTSNNIEAGIGNRTLVSGMVNMIAPQTFVKRGKHDCGHGNRPMAYRAGYVQWFGLLIADEAHHGVADYYGSCVRSWPGPVIGLTATPWLMSDFNSLGEGMCSPGQLSGPWNTIKYSPEAKELIGVRLSDIEVIRVSRTLRVRHEMLKTNIMQADGYDSKSVDLEVDRVLSIGPSIVKEWKLYGGEPTMAFCRSVDAAEKSAEVFRQHGYRVAVVTAKTPEDDRRQALNDLQDGKIDWLASVDVFGEGVNIPNVRNIAMLRPTMSITRLRQFLGRGLRKRPDGSPLRVLDFADNCALLGSPLEGWGLELLQGHYKKMGLEARREKATKGKKLFDTKCPNCAESCNWNQEFCLFCDEPLSWTCSDADVELTDGAMIRVNGHHTREWCGNFNKSQEACDEAVNQAIFEHTVRLEQEQVEKRKERRAEREKEAAANALELERKREERKREETERMRLVELDRTKERRNNWKWKESRGLHARTSVISDRDKTKPYELMLTSDATHLIATRGSQEPIVRKCEGDTIEEREAWAKTFMLLVDPQIHADAKIPTGTPYRLDDQGWGIILNDKVGFKVGEQFEGVATARSGREYHAIYEVIGFHGNGRELGKTVRIIK